MKFEVSSATEKGKRPYQEDRLVIHETSEVYLLGVFDGHGGDEVADKCAVLMPKVFDAVRSAVLVANFENMVREVFHVLNAETKDCYAGTAASIVLLPKHGKEAIIGILGDAPVMLQKTDGDIWLSPEHNVRTNSAERAAAEGRGGTVHNGYLFATFSGGGLQMSRALGDRELGKVLDRTPEIFRVPVGAGGFILVASDGLFDPSHEECPKDEISAKIKNGLDAQQLANDAVCKPTFDNVSAILVKISEDR